MSSAAAQLCSSPRTAPPPPHLVRGSHKANPAVIQGDDKVPLEQLHVHLATAEQHQRVHGHHAAVPDEHSARLDLLVVHQVRALKVPGLGQGRDSLVRLALLFLPLPLLQQQRVGA